MSLYLEIMLAILGLSIFICLLRLIKGPTVFDRIVALDLISTQLIAVIGTLSIFLQTAYFLEVILVITLLVFVGTVAYAKYLQGGPLIE